MSGAPTMTSLRPVIAVLARIQREEATGTLAAAAPAGGALTFQSGRLVSATLGGREAPAAEMRSVAREILCAAAGGGVEFHAAVERTAASACEGLLNAGDLLLDLAGAAADPESVRNLLGGPSARLAPSGSPPKILPRLALGPSEAFLLSRVDGTLGLDEVVAVSPLDEAETLKAVFGLLAAGLIEAPGVEMHDAAPPAAKAVPSAAKRPASERRSSALDDFLKRTAAAGAPPADPTSPPAEPSVAGTRAESPPRQAERTKIEERIAECQGADHYAILGVDRNADEETIRSAYYKLAKIYHPDRYRSAEHEGIFEQIERTFAATTEAYNTLTNETLRSEYDRHLAEKAGGARTQEADLAAQARESYLRGRKHLEAEEYFDALRLLEVATQMDSTKPDYWFHLGVVQTKNPRWRKRAEESLLKVIGMNPSHLQAYLHLARLYKSGGLQRRAVEMYEKVLQWEPENEEALVATGRKKPAVAGASRGIRSIFKGPKS